MKGITYALAIAMTIPILAALPSAQAVSGNLLTNPSFEADNLLTGWDVWIPGDLCTYSHRTDWASDGAKSVLVTNTGAGGGTYSCSIEQSVPLTSGRYYTLSADFNLVSGVGTELRMDVFRSDGSWTGAATLTVTADGRYTMADMWTAPEHAFARISHYVYGPGSSYSDNFSFIDSTTQCRDGVNNDGDAWTDYPNDPGCTSIYDDSESPNSQCSDGLNNDGDAWTDYPNDPGCTSIYDDSESPNPQCSDGVDNDGDGSVDYPADGGCGNLNDNAEEQTGLTCLAYNPNALTNLCIEQRTETQTTNVPTPTVTPGPPRPPVCIVSNICTPPLPGVPVLGFTQTPVQHPSAVVSGYVEATIVCDFNLPCRVEV